MSNNSTKLSKLLQNALDELNEELFLKKENKLSHNQSLIIKLFEKYEYRENNGDDDTDYQNAHIFIRDLLNNNSFGKKEMLDVLPQLKFNSDLYDILVDDFLYLDEKDENGNQMNIYNVRDKGDYWTIGRTDSDRE
jgi:hypothetical protein|tara:strand:+ start:104 stop:511 length:408 start_codon:yes stop_codon:yes gene_type:complete